MMYNKRIKIFIIFSSLLLLLSLARLMQMQLTGATNVQKEIDRLKEQRGLTEQLRTLRGQILDRNGKILAYDKPIFSLQIDYSLSCYLDDRVMQGKLLFAGKSENPQKAIEDTQETINKHKDDLDLIIEKCARFRAVNPSEIRKGIEKINDNIWNQRMFYAWRNAFPESEVSEKYDSYLSIPISVAKDDFSIKEPNLVKRLELISKADILEMDLSFPLIDLETDDDIFTAQVEFLDIEGVKIAPSVRRHYPYKSVAAQTIGWVGPATQPEDLILFADDRLQSYLEGEVCGREDGVEYVCEEILRGRRGELNQNIDKQLVSQIDSRLGQDVVLTLDIELQKIIEEYLYSYDHAENCGPEYGISAVVLDAVSSEILSLVSLPTYDLNRVRYDYNEITFDKNKPRINRAINENYPAGSVVKPLIFIAGMETGHTTPERVIECPGEPSPSQWPNCWIYNQRQAGHSWAWENNGRNALKGSCNIYFSHLADEIEADSLQHWLYEFGYGHILLSSPPAVVQSEFPRNLIQSPGIISSRTPDSKDLSLEELPPIRDGEKRYFGIGQGNLRVTPLQVANSMASIAKGGLTTTPKLFKDIQTAKSNPLGIMPEAMEVVYDGMQAVVNESQGTAYDEFSLHLESFAEQDVRIYGKTGSTEDPCVAWFAGFAQDSQGRILSLAVVVENGQHGSRDAAPLIRDILQFCIDLEYIGDSTTPTF